MKTNVDFMKLVYGFHKTMQEQGFSLVYEGEITHDITKAFTSLAENNMERLNEDTGVKKRVFHVMVECLQNLAKHSEESGQSEYGVVGNGIFIVGRFNEANTDYHIITGNPIETAKIPELQNLLETINQLDKTGLKELYKKQMVGGTYSDKGGAGLGLIDIARKTGEKLEYHFETLDDTTSFFMLRTKVTRKID